MLPYQTLNCHHLNPNYLTNYRPPLQRGPTHEQIDRDIKVLERAGFPVNHATKNLLHIIAESDNIPLEVLQSEITI